MFSVQTGPHAGPAPVRALSLQLALVLAMSLATPLAAQGAEAMRVVRDPVTGELRGPTAAEAAAFEKAEAQLRLRRGKAAPAKPQPTEIHYPDGTVETKLGEDTMMYSVVREQGDGTLAMQCLPAKQAREFVKGTKKSSTSKAQAKAGHVHE